MLIYLLFRQKDRKILGNKGRFFFPLLPYFLDTRSEQEDAQILGY